MKRTYLTYLTFACMLGTFTSCTQNEMPDAGGDTAGTEESAVQRIGIQLASDNGNDGLARAGRPLYSNQPAQMVDKVALVICNDANQVVVCKLVDKWETVSEVYETSGHGRKAVIELNEVERLPATSANYTLYAIGYTSREGNQTDYTVKTSESESKTPLYEYLSELKKYDTFAPDLVLHLEDEPGEEIFAGSVSFTTYASGGFDNTVVLNRQVAGTYVYVKDVPYVEGASILRLTASADNDGLVLGEFANENIEENGKGTGKYVMNGTSPKSSDAPYTVCEINLSQWMSDGLIKQDGTLVAVDKWQTPSQYSGKATFKEGSFYSGSFLIPFAAVSGQQSLTLGLYKESNSKPVKTWNVNLSQSDVNKQSNVIWHWDSSQSKFQNPSGTTPVAESKNSYSVLRNHLYCIGRRDKDNNPGSSDKDEPQALEDVTELIIKVIADWDVVYDMILEPEPSQF